MTHKLRLWKLGVWNATNPGRSIIPTQQSVDRLREILRNAKKDTDIVWGGPPLSVEVIEGDVDVIVKLLEDGSYKIEFIQ